ncbi:DUF4230 domain-containing protein, partial [Streptomyces sp. NPDC051020]|uniref:DUF4230 domain-containing protein n=1 Tax=Streptomyces sp. NPDC051020 TaxID=3155409 RepID=UPI00341E1727
ALRGPLPHNGHEATSLTRPANRTNPNRAMPLEQAVNKLAAQHIGEAAKESGLTQRAEKNTTSMLQGLLGSLGFEKVTVGYGKVSP